MKLQLNRLIPFGLWWQLTAAPRDHEGVGAHAQDVEMPSKLMDVVDSPMACVDHPQNMLAPAKAASRFMKWLLPGAMVLRMMAMVFVVIVLVGAGTAVLVAQVAGNEALQRLVAQQTDEVEIVSRLLSSKIEQSQKVLRAVAGEITPSMLENPSAAEWMLQQGLPAVRFFDAVYLVTTNGDLQIAMRGGRLERSDAERGESLPAQEAAVIRSTVAEGKPLVVAQTPNNNADAGASSGAVSGAGGGDARVVFTVPINGADGRLLGVLAGTLRLQSQGLLPPSLVLPANDGSRLMVLAQNGALLAHSDGSRTLGHVRDEPGLATVYQQWQKGGAAYQERGFSSRVADNVISVSSMPLPQWLVVRVSDITTLMAPFRTAQRQAAWQVGTLVILAALLVSIIMARLAQPLAQLTQRAAKGAWNPNRLSVGGVVNPNSNANSNNPLNQFSAHGDEGVGLPAAASVMQHPWSHLPRRHEAWILAQALQTQSVRHAQQQAHYEHQAAYLAGILEAASVGIVITQRGVVQVVSRQASHMLGYRPDELQGQPARLVYASDEDFARVHEQARAGFAAHGSFDGDVAFLRKDGATVWARVQGRVLQPEHAHNPANSNAGTVWILEDLTAAREWPTPPGWDSLYDPLTRLPNRDGFAQRLQMLLAERARRVRSLPLQRVKTDTAPVPSDAGARPDSPQTSTVSQHDGVALFIDIDHFTLVNDVAGHDAGDDVLRHVARLLESQVRAMGWVARLGGDEFMVVLPGCPLARGYAVAEQLRQALHDWKPAYQGRSFKLGASIGLVVLDATTHDVPAVLRAADMACYAAKRAGRNRVKVIRAGEVISGFGGLGV